MQVQFKRLNPEIPAPEYKTAGAAGFDIPVSETALIPSGETRIVPTGLVVCVPAGHVLMLTCRSSSAKKGLMLANGVGTIDQDYCGPTDELKLAIYNAGKTPYQLERFERVAQGLIIPIIRAKFQEVKNLQTPNRGGFGTTG